MHNMTVRALSFRAFNGAGARGTVDSMETGHLMQEMTGGFYKGEQREKIEHFEPYGYTSAIVPRNSDGVAEAMMSFIGGSRAHSSAGVVADRRYRPRGPKPGETAQYDDIGQMTLMRRNGLYLLSMDGAGGSTQGGGQPSQSSGAQQTTPNAATSAAGAPAAGTLAASSSSGGQSSSGGSSQNQ